MNSEHDARGRKVDEEQPGLPWFRSWRSVYTFVLVSFAVFVGLLTWFSHAFSR